MKHSLKTSMFGFNKNYIKNMFDPNLSRKVPLLSFSVWF